MTESMEAYMRCRMHLPHLSQHGKQQYGSSLDILTLVNIDTKKENSYTKYDIGISEDIGRGMLIRLWQEFH